MGFRSVACATLVAHPHTTKRDRTFLEIMIETSLNL